jgi:hypothetical protein
MTTRPYNAMQMCDLLVENNVAEALKAFSDIILKDPINTVACSTLKFSAEFSLQSHFPISHYCRTLLVFYLSQTHYRPFILFIIFRHTSRLAVFFSRNLVLNLLFSMPMPSFEPFFIRTTPSHLTVSHLRCLLNFFYQSPNFAPLFAPSLLPRSPLPTALWHTWRASGTVRV